LDKWSVIALAITLGIISFLTGFYVENLGSGEPTTAVNPNPIAESVHIANASLGLELFLSSNSKINEPGQTFAINITEYNYENSTNQVQSQNDWVISGLSVGPCSGNLPFGFSVFVGNYSLQDLSALKQKTGLMLYQPGTYNCPAVFNVQGYIFSPHSNNASIMDDGTIPFGALTSVGYFSGSWNTILSWTLFQRLLPGVYTVVAGDEWGDVVLLHFTIDT